MNRLSLCALAATLAVAPLAAKADTVINLNATTGNASTSYGGGYNNLAPSFYQTLTLGPGTYSVTAVGAGTKASDGTTAVYSGFSYASTGTGPAPGSYSEKTGIDIGGTFSNASAANGFQNSYTSGTSDTTIFSALFASNAAAIAGNSSYFFTLASTTAVNFYVSDNSFAPTSNYYGYDDNTGGVSLDVKAVTPEPSSLMLLGTGILSLAGAAKRRFKA